jgi:surface antigen
MSHRNFAALALGIVLAGCNTEVGEGSTAPAPSGGGVAFRGGTLAVAQAGTSFDLDELKDRNNYATTLAVGEDVKWQASEALFDPDASRLNVAFSSELGDKHLVVGTIETEEGPDCVLVQREEGGLSFVLSRPEGKVACPKSLGEVLAWVPSVTLPRAVSSGETGSVSQALSYGSYVGAFNGINAYSNGSNGYVSGVYSCCGLQWQCVEFPNRYYSQKLGHKNLKGTGNANTYFSTASSKGLVAYANGGSTPPAVGDMLPSAGGPYGHIALVREVGSNYIKVIHQNWSNDTRDSSKTLSMSVINGKYTVGPFSASYPVQGWMRR